MRKRTNILGKYTPKNKLKCWQGSCVYRSMWERKVMLYLDRSEHVHAWSSEKVEVPYVSPKDDRWHTYYPDFWVRYTNDQDEIVEAVLEVKPHSQKRWAVNKAKWKAARAMCEEKGWDFIVLTEKEIKP
jgi:hypothetical protein